MISVQISMVACRAGGRTGRVSGVLCDRKMNVKIKVKVYRTDSGRPKTSIDVRGRDMGVEEGTGK